MGFWHGRDLRGDTRRGYAARAWAVKDGCGLVPAIADDDLTPDISGIRAKLQGPGQSFRDFVIAEESARGLPGWINLIGIDSPGLTSSLAIADEVARLVRD